MTICMPNILRVAAVVQGARRGGRRNVAIVCRVIRSLLFLVIAWCLWSFISPAADKAKLHGAVIGGVAVLFTLQEFLFFQTRSRVTETLKSIAIPSEDLSEMLIRCQRLKCYLDAVWLWSLASKISALVVGPILFFGLLEKGTVQVRGVVVGYNDCVAILGWFCILTGAYLTLRTFRAFRHVDAFVSKLEVEAREITAQRDSAKALKDAPVEDWTNDTSLSGYARARTPRDKNKS
jgi:hypothetical protein